MPNVNIVEEMVDMVSASRAYQANVAAMNATRDLIRNALSLG
jgi:flagellar basal-body rod protein FlgC